LLQLVNARAKTMLLLLLSLFYTVEAAMCLKLKTLQTACAWE